MRKTSLINKISSKNVVSNIRDMQVLDEASKAELFRQCATCGTIYGLYEVKTEQSVSGFAPTSDDPFDSQKGIVLSAHKRRNTKAGKRELDKRRRERLRPHDDDPEIDALLRIYGEENVRIIKQF
jgi:hypothetical protein